MDIRFDGKRALVTGAGRGIGNAIAKALATFGADTVALSRSQGPLDQLKAEFPQIVTVCVDLSDWTATRKAVEDIGHIDLLVNNAATLFGSSFFEIDEPELNSMFDVNVKAVINVSQVVARGMIERGVCGAIVHVSSILSQRGAQNRTAYCASKGAVDQIMRVMTLELGPHQIRVNCVNPSLVLTDTVAKVWADPVKCAPLLERTPRGRLTEVDDVVNAVMYLLSDKADMINGTTLMVDGGFTAC